MGIPHSELYPKVKKRLLEVEKRDFTLYKLLLDTYKDISITFPEDTILKILDIIEEKYSSPKHRLLGGLNIIFGQNNYEATIKVYWSKINIDQGNPRTLVKVSVNRSYEKEFQSSELIIKRVEYLSRDEILSNILLSGDSLSSFINGKLIRLKRKDYLLYTIYKKVWNDYVKEPEIMIEFIKNTEDVLSKTKLVGGIIVEVNTTSLVYTILIAWSRIDLTKYGTKDSLIVTSISKSKIWPYSSNKRVVVEKILSRREALKYLYYGQNEASVLYHHGGREDQIYPYVKNVDPFDRWESKRKISKLDDLLENKLKIKISDDSKNNLILLSYNYEAPAVFLAYTTASKTLKRLGDPSSTTYYLITDSTAIARRPGDLSVDYEKDSRKIEEEIKYIAKRLRQSTRQEVKRIMAFLVLSKSFKRVELSRIPFIKRVKKK